MLFRSVFAFGFPKDKMDELQRAQMELQMKLGSRREIMERMGKQNIPDLLNEIDDDTVAEAVLQARIAALSSAGGEEAPSTGNEENVDETPDEFGEEQGSEEF